MNPQHRQPATLAQKLAASAADMRPSLDDLLSTLNPFLDAYDDLPGDERHAATGRLTDADRQMLLGLAGRCAERALDDRDPTWIKRGILCCAISEFLPDVRDAIMHFILLCHSAKLLGVDIPTRLLMQAKAFDGATQARLIELSNRPEAINHLSDYEVALHTREGKHHYRPTRP